MPAVSPRVRRGAVVVVVLALVLMWIYAFSGLGRRDPADRLTDAAFAGRAEAVCEAARARLDALPHVTHESPPQDLAANVDTTAGILGEMVGMLRTIPIGEQRDERIVSLWLDDWETYVGDLREYAVSVREDGYRTFTETEREGTPLSEAMDTMAGNNDMPSCETP